MQQQLDNRHDRVKLSDYYHHCNKNTWLIGEKNPKSLDKGDGEDNVADEHKHRNTSES